jgi:ribulose-5-phosphate 4-epimerase/fuculose-1-phosphate aldolase
MSEASMDHAHLRDDVLAACHALAAYELGTGIGGHVSVRVPGRDQFWTNVLDRCFEEMTEEDIVLLDFEGNLLEGGRGVSPGIGFHPGIYSLREDVGAVVHTHGFWITAQSGFARPPRMWHNLCTYFSERTAVAPDDSIESIAPALKDTDVAIVIPWHGAITVGRTLGEAAALHQTLDYAARLDVTMSKTSAEPMPDEACLRIRALVESADYLEHTWQLMKRRGANVHGLITVGAS